MPSPLVSKESDNLMSMRTRNSFFCLAMTLAFLPGVLVGVPCAGAAAIRADNYEDALAQAKASGSDIVVFQRGSDWNRLGETLYREIWQKDEFARTLGDGFILVAVDRPEGTAETPVSRLVRLTGEKTPLPACELTAVESAGKIPFAVRPDGAFLGKMTPNPDKDTLTLKLKAKRGGSVLRLDFLADPSLPGGGPGRGGNGNFAISEIVVRDARKVLAIDAAWASSGSGDRGAWQAIDGIADNPDNLWNPGLRNRQSCTLLLALAEAFPADSEISVQLICRSQSKQQVPGCVRAAGLAEAAVAADVRAGAKEQRTMAKNARFSWWDTTICPRLALLDSQGRAVACENKPRPGLTPVTLAARVKELRAIREKRDALWTKAEKAGGPEKAELLRQGLDAMGFANWAGNDKCYAPIHDRIRAADPKDESGAARWLTFGGDPRDGLKWAEPRWSKALEKKPLADADFQEALARIDNELKDPRNKALDHERLQRIMVAKYLVYFRWPKNQEKRFDVQREIAALDPDTFWGIGATGDLAMNYLTPTPRLTYGWNARQLKAGLNVWDMRDTAYFFDHAGPYRIRVFSDGGKDGLKIRRIALLEGSTVLAECRPAAGIVKGKDAVEADLDLKTWSAERQLVLRVEAEATAGQTDIKGKFEILPQLPPAPALPARSPEADDVSMMLERGEIGALQQKLGDALMADVAKKGYAGIRQIVNAPGWQTILAQQTLIRLCGVEKVTDIARLDGGARFLQALFNNQRWLDSFLSSDKAVWPASWAAALENLYILHRHGTGWEQPVNERIGTALALQWGHYDKAWSYRLVERFGLIRKSMNDGLLHASFESLSVREMRFAVPTIGTAKDYQFFLDDRQTRIKDYLGTHGAARYVRDNVYGISIHDGAVYYTPWMHAYGTCNLPVHRRVGGVCGACSNYGSVAAQTHGVPSTTIGQPGHCAYVVRVGQEWPVGNSVTWPSDITLRGWDGSNYGTLNRLYEPIFQDRENCLAATRLGWLAQLQADRARANDPKKELSSTASTAWMKTYEQAILAQPINYVTWIDYIKLLETVKDVPAATWLDLGQRAAQTFSAYNEAGWALARRCLDKALPGMTPAERMAVLLKCNQELRQENWYKPDVFPYDGILNWQADRIGDPALAVEFFGKQLAIHYSDKPDGNFIFGNVLSWGAKRFAGNPKTAPGYAKTMEAFLNAKGGALNKNQLAAMLQTGIRKAGETGDLVSFRLWADMAEKLLPPLKPGDIHLKPKQAADFPKFAPFPGDLLSEDGMLQISSANPDDRPLSYRQLLCGGGGWFDTGSDKRPWAQVQLPGDGELTGIILVGRYEYPPAPAAYKAAPLKVSVSQDGRTWTEVASFDKDEMVFRIDLQGQNLQARYVRAERVPAAADAKPFERFNLRGFLVYGKKLY